MGEPTSIEFAEVVDNPKKRDILRSPDKDLKVTYVIPIKGEVKNGNIFHQLKDFTLQDCPVNNFEAIYVVNNTEEDRAAQNDSFRENQQLLSLFAFIAGESDAPPDGLEEWQRRIVMTAKEKDLRVQALDLSADNYSGLGISRDTWRARTEGVNTAVSRFTETDISENGAIVRMDADTKIDRHVTSQVISQLVNRSDILMLRILYDTIPGEGGRKLYETTSEKRLINNLNNFRMLLFDSSDWFAVKVGVYGKEMLERRDQTAAANDIKIYTQDRARERGIGGAFSQSRRESLEQGRGDFKQELSEQLTRLKQIPTLSQAIKRRIEEALSSPYDNVSDYIDVYRAISETIAGEDHIHINELRSTVSDTQKLEQMRHAVVSGIVNRVLERMYDPDKGQVELSEDNMHEYLSDTQQQQTSKTHFVQNNPWLIDVLNEVRQEASNPEAARELLNQKFPELLLPFEETTYAKANATILGLIKFIEKSKS